MKLYLEENQWCIILEPLKLGPECKGPCLFCPARVGNTEHNTIRLTVPQITALTDPRWAAEVGG